MRVEIKIDSELPEPYAILHIPNLTAEIGVIVETLKNMDGAINVLTVKRDGKSYVIEPSQVELIRTEGGNVILYNRVASSFIVDKPLREIAQRLGNDFVRISKSAIVNIRRIDHVSPSFNSTMDIIMKNGMNEYITRKYLGGFKKCLGL